MVSLLLPNALFQSLTICTFQGKRREGSSQAVFYHSFFSGCIAGCVASFSVNPFDGRYSVCHLARSKNVT